MYNFNNSKVYYFVNGIKEAKGFPMNFSNEVTLMDSNKPVIYLKT